VKKNSVQYLQGMNFSQLALAETTEIKNLVCLTLDLVFTRSSLNRINLMWENLSLLYDKHETRGGAVGWGSALQTGRSQVRFLMVSLNFLLTSFRPRCGPGCDSACNTIEYLEYFLADKGGRCLGLTTVPPSYVDCLEMWEPHIP